MNTSIKIRPAQPSDAPDLLRIYAPYVEKTAVTFEYTVPSVEDFTQRITNIKARFPYLLAEIDGRPVGYAYAGVFHARKAYEWSVETTVYVDLEMHGHGIGRCLYEHLERALKLMGVTNANACIATIPVSDETLSDASVRFHEKMGYRMVGEFIQCGCKFARWYNMCWMEKHLAPHLPHPKDVIPFPLIEADFLTSLSEKEITS